MDLVPRIDPASVEPTRTKLVYYNPNETGFGVYMTPEEARQLAAQRIPTLAENMAAYILALRERGS
jgi:hypothetical protein